MSEWILAVDLLPSLRSLRILTAPGSVADPDNLQHLPGADISQHLVRSQQSETAIESLEKSNDTAGRIPRPDTWTGSPRLGSQVTAKFNVVMDRIFALLELERLWWQSPELETWLYVSGGAMACVESECALTSTASGGMFCYFYVV